MESSDLNIEFEGVLKLVVAPVFKRLGFKKSGAHFFRQTGELIQTFNIQKELHSLGRETSFTGNVGFIEPVTYLKLYNTSSLPKFPKCADALIQFRLGQLTDKTDYWYRLTKASNRVTFNEQVKGKLVKDLNTVEKFFEKHQTLSSIEEFVDDRTKINPFWAETGQFALYKRLGKDKLASELLKDTYKKAQKPKSWLSFLENINGIWGEKKSKPEVNLFWVEKIEQIAKAYDEKIK